MRLENVAVVARREYMQRVRTKGFWIATLILPLFVVAAAVVPSIIMAKSRTEQQVVVVDPVPTAARGSRRSQPS